MDVFEPPRHFEQAYKDLLEKIMLQGQTRKGRNGITKSLFGLSIEIEELAYDLFPIVTGRKMFIKGIAGELAAFLHQPKSLADFERFGCNYWSQWAKEDGSLNVDYGNKWFDFHGVNQMARLIASLVDDPAGRRHIITAWDPSNLDKLDLPCCHHTYQWYVNDNHLEMFWSQRSTDMMIGLPSDIVLAALMNILVANTVGLLPGKITMALGDSHIYAEHFEGVHQYLGAQIFTLPAFDLDSTIGTFAPSDLLLGSYNSGPVIKFELKA